MFLFHKIKKTCLKKPVKEYTIKSYDEGECLICLMKFQKDEVVSLINCNHKYHTSCLYTWFERKKTCPICNELLDIDLD